MNPDTWLKSGPVDPESNMPLVHRVFILVEGEGNLLNVFYSQNLWPYSLRGELGLMIVKTRHKQATFSLYPLPYNYSLFYSSWEAW